MKPRLAGLFILIILTFCMTGCQSDDQRVTIISEGGRVDVQVEVMRTDEERQQGLMERKSLADGFGMLFVYQSNEQPIMWMKNMVISLDMVFVGKDMKINHIEENVRPCDSTDDGKCALYRSPCDSTLVLELPAGYTKKNGIVAGNQIELVGIGGF
jgi:uncharacterized protein